MILTLASAYAVLTLAVIAGLVLLALSAGVIGATLNTFGLWAALIAGVAYIGRTVLQS